MKAELARLNHILIPTTKAGRDRYRNGRLWRRLRPFGWLLARLSREGRALFALALLAVLFSGDPSHTESHVLVLATASLLFAALLFTRAYRLKAVTATLSLPRRVTLGDTLTIRITLHNRADAAQRALRIEPPLLPWDGSFVETPADIALLTAHGNQSTLARARFIQRGAHELDPFRIAALLPLGLSQGPSLYTPAAHFVVVPRIARVTSLAVPERRRHQPGGIARASRTGDATELLGLRPYRPGDPLRDLHARSWARHGSPMVREYQEEYFTRVGVVVDTDAGAKDTAALEAGLSLAAGVIARLCRGEAVVDVLVTAEHSAPLALGRSLGSLDQALDVLAAVRALPGFDAERLFGHIAPHLERLSALVLVCLGWDDARAGLAARVRARGVTPLVLVVSAEATGEARAAAPVTWVSLEAITRGQELAL